MGSNNTVTFISKSSQIAKNRNENVNVLLDHLRSNPNHVIYETLLSIQSSSHSQLNEMKPLFFAIRFITGVTFVGEKRSNWRGYQLPFCDFRTGRIFHFGDSWKKTMLSNRCQKISNVENAKMRVNPFAKTCQKHREKKTNWQTSANVSWGVLKHFLCCGRKRKKREKTRYAWRFNDPANASLSVQPLHAVAERKKTNEFCACQTNFREHKCTKRFFFVQDWSFRHTSKFSK